MDKLWSVVLLTLLGACCTLAVVPTNFQLTSYDLTLTVPSATSTTASGSLIIVLTCTAAVTSTTATSVSLNWGTSLIPTTPTATNIGVTQTATGAAASTLAITTPVVSSETVTFSVTSAFAIGDLATITITYQTTISSDKVGLFRIQYTNTDNTTSTLITTNVKPSYARNVFPCFDEPSLPAPLTLRTVRPSTWTAAISSLAYSTATTDTATSTTTDTFTAASLPPNVLNIFLSSDMVMSNHTVTGRSNTSVTFWAKKGFGTSYQNNMDYLASNFYDIENFLGLLFPRSGGINVVLVPNLDAPIAGYGVIFIRDDNYAIDYTTAQSEGLFIQNVVPVLKQFILQFTEFSTRPSSWTDSWMSDAMAGFLLGTFLTSTGSPFDFDTDLEVIARQSAMAMDSPTGSPLAFTATSITTTNALVQALQNQLRTTKGPFLLSMADMALPAGTVLSAIKTFLKNNQQASVASSGLITQFDTTAKAEGGYYTTFASTFATTLGTWFSSAGYPLVNVASIVAGTPGSVTMTMARFCGTSASASCTNVLPTYSLAATVGSTSEPRYYTSRQGIWVSNAAPATASLNINSTDWIVANLRSSGYYRAQYPTATWALIQTAVAAGTGAIQGRTQVIDDAFALGLSGDLDLNVPLALAVANMKENQYRNWFPVYLGLSQIRDRLYGLTNYASFSAYTTAFLQTLNTPLNNGSFTTYEAARTSSLFYRWMCEFNVGTYRSTAATNLASLLAGSLPTTVPSSSYDSMVCCAASNSATLSATTLWTAVASTSSSYYTKHFNAIALGCLSSYTAIATVINTTLAADVTLKPYVTTVFQYLAEEHPSELLSGIPAIATTLQTAVGAPTMASIIYRAGNKINTNTINTALTTLSTSAVDTIVVTAATTTTTAITTRMAWLTSRQASLVSALSATKIVTNSGATTTVMSLTILLPFLVILSGTT